MKLFKQATAATLTAGLLVTTILQAEKPLHRRSPLAKPMIQTAIQFDGNRILDWMENNGMIVSHAITGHSGLEWPAGLHIGTIFASGVWLAGEVDGDIRIAVGEYGGERVPGPWGSDGDAAEHKIYKVSKSDLADPLASDDFQNWPVDYGAPWVDEDPDGDGPQKPDGIYTPMPNGPDHPEFIGDQVIWMVTNDGDPVAHSIFGTLPMGIEVQTTIWGYDRPDAFGDMMFVKELIINTGGNTVEDTYIGLWSDPDLGDAGDDFVACDTTLGLGIVYNDGVDHDYAGFSGGTPAAGYDFFQGPIIPSAGDTAFMFGRFIPGFKNMKMTSFSKYINTSDPNWSDPNDPDEVYNLMRGLKKDGSPATNTETGEVTKYFYPDDPSFNTGAGDDVWADSDDHASGDRRFLMNAGPFTLAPGDSQEVVFGILAAAAGDPLKSYRYLKEVDALAQKAYDIQFALPASPTQPEVTVTTLPEEIILTWDDAVEDYEVVDEIDLLPVPVAYDTTYVTVIVDVITTTHDTTIVGTDTTITTTVDTSFVYTQEISEIDTTFEGQPTKFVFEGYNVYQYETSAGAGDQKLIATYDLINGVTEIFDDVFDANFGENINRRVQFGSDSGVRRHISISNDALNNGIPLKTNREYYFAVVAYGYNPYGIPRTLESSPDILAIRPKVSNSWAATDVTAGFGDSFQATHSDGKSDGSVAVVVIDPTALTGDSYKLSFTDQLIEDGDTTAVINWLLTNTSTNTVLVPGNTIQGGVDFATGGTVNVGANPIKEGFQVQVSGPPLEFKDFYATENADGPIDGWAGAAADYYDYPGMGRTNIGNQQASGARWFISTSNSSNIAYGDFYPYVTRYSGGYGNPAGGIGYLIPDDFEFRFTETGAKMLNRTSDLIVDSPMEIWNVGDVGDPADDFQLLGIFNDSDANDEWNLFQDDSPLSGAGNDPYMETFYVLEHMDRAPGSDGYEAMVAAFEADPKASGNYEWATGPGLPLAAEGQITRVVLLNLTFVSWNGGDVTAEDWPAGVVLAPESGTIFRLVTTKPNATTDVFAFSTEDVMGETITYQSDQVKAWPNPYFGYNPEERNLIDQQMHFTHLPEAGKCTIRIFDLTGSLVRTIAHNDAGSQYEVWDLRNNYGLPVASGMYLVHVETAAGEQVLKLAIIQPEQRLDSY